ncbi:SusC/RagA family TonB-linked outer membrane protein [Proteiniphilum sp. X52]|uniref:SusC/RagA family TonB-linked outer membrane protein n=1 Tax=Proteiniphilum sp. X52 TaxID=2382159 RepID=UPI000F09EA5B|nr:SusC/RagA family TonB-linked outer membrane protein [Proteiniphilum sp. X52]RNC63325.1 SusC/RagA family TonB-linked outer membrane protein [Proteiniphilum sp. X52]
MKRKLMMFLTLFLMGIGLSVAQTQVRGTVVDESGEPVIGATIQIKGTSQGTVTDADGNFNLSAPSGGTLVVSYVGMRTREVPVSANVRVEMTTDSQMLDEVIAVAYGTTRRSSFTGSAATVNAAAIENRVITNITSVLEGNASGVQATSALGQPGSSSSIRIRGFGSVNASNAPLYVVDGAVYNGNIADINPFDIESVSVLKDAASTSLYGSSAGNGVILITTKKGKAGASVNLSITQGGSRRAYSDYSRVNVWEYYPLQWEMLKNSYVSVGNSSSEAAQLASANIVNTLKYNPFTGVADGDVVGTDGLLNPAATQLKWGDDLDWEDAAYGTGYRQEYVLSYNSTTDKSDTYASIGYLDDKGYMLKTDFERFSGRLNYNITPKKWFKSGVNLALSRINSNYSTSTSDNSSSYSNLARYIRVMAPIYPVHRHDLGTGAYLDQFGNSTTNPDEYVYDYEGARLSNNGRDAVAETELNMRDISRVNVVGRTYITLTPVKGLNITANYGIENADLRRKVYENPYVGDGTAGPGRLNILSTRTFSETFNQLITYERSIDDLHNFDILLGHENNSYKYDYYYSMKTNEIVEGVYDYPNFTNISNLSSYTNLYRKEGYFTRLNYDFDHRYYLSFSYRRDGSSRFSKENRWGNFYSLGGSWRISQENFMQDLHWVNNLRLRTSYGQTGVDDVLDEDGYSDYYPYQTLYSLGINNGLEAGAYFSNLANINLLWETQVSTDVALEFGLFDRLSGVIEYFRKDSKDLLFPVSIPASIGVTSQVQNIGKVRNSGWELGLDYQIVKQKDWSLSMAVNGTFLTNKIVSLPEDNRENGIIDGSKKLYEGKSRYEFWLRQWYGVNPANGDGLYYFDTEAYNESDGTMTAAARNSIVEIDGKQLTNSYSYAKYDFSGSSIPKLYGGFSFNIRYKSFTLTPMFSYSIGGKILDLNYASLMSMSNYGYSMHEDVKKAWRKEGDISDVPRLERNDTHATNIGQSYSTRWLVSASYLNFRSLSLAYELPRNLVKAYDLSNIRLNLSAENLFMMKARAGLNPQGNYNGLTYHEYMPARILTFGLNLSF